MKKVAAAALVVAALAGLWFGPSFFFYEGITVELRNTGAEPLRAAIVHVTGNSYPLGDLPAGSSKKVVVAPTGESHVEIEHEGHTPLIVDCYFEPGYTGTITVEVTPQQVGRVQSSIRL